MTGPTPEQMRELEKDAFAALQEATNAGHLRMTIPADPEKDTDLRIAAALAALRATADEMDRQRPPVPTREQIADERQRQIEKGYDKSHDLEHGVGHLLRWSLDYAVRGESVKAAALTQAALDIYYLPTRDEMIRAVITAGVDWEGRNTGSWDRGAQVVDAVLALIQNGAER